MAAGFVLLVTVGAVSGGAFAKPAGPVPIEVTARRIDSFSASGARRFGALDFRGGLVLSSTFEGFGGLSGFTLDSTGTRFLAVTDKGLWIAGRLEVDGDRPTGLADVVAAPILGADGRPLAAQGRGDVEALVRTTDGYAIGIERQQEIWSFAGSDPLAARGHKVATGGVLAKLGYNEGIEALAEARIGAPPRPTLIAIAETSPDQPAELPGFLFGGKTIGRFKIVRSKEFAATDMAIGPGRTVYLLERFYTPAIGVKLRLRRFPLAEVKPGARIEGEVLIEAGMGTEIDNMEGLAVHVNAAGETILTMVSDDNFSNVQRTLLLRFAVVE